MFDKLCPASTWNPALLNVPPLIQPISKHWDRSYFLKEKEEKEQEGITECGSVEYPPLANIITCMHALTCVCGGGGGSFSEVDL